MGGSRPTHSMGLCTRIMDKTKRTSKRRNGGRTAVDNATTTGEKSQICLWNETGGGTTHNTIQGKYDGNAETKYPLFGTLAEGR